MPHLSFEYSANLAEHADIGALCEALRQAAVALDAFPEAGVRVRAIRCDHHAIADGHPDNIFCDISVRLRAGRPAEVKKAATEALFEAARAALAPVLAAHPLMLSMEMREIDPELSPKLNTVRDHMETRR